MQPSYWIAIAILLAGGLTMLIQYSLALRYRRGLKAWQRSSTTLLGAPDFFQAVHALGHSRKWAERSLHAFVSHLELQRGRLRVDYATDLLRETEDALWRTGVVKFTAGSMMILGLGGTFFSFIILLTTSGMMEALNQFQAAKAQDSGPLLKAFGTVFFGFGHAFSASLAGLLTTTGIAFLNLVFVDRLRSRFLLNAVTCAHQWEEHLRPATSADPDEAFRPKITPQAPEPPPRETAPAEHSLALAEALKSVVSEMAASQDRWTILANAIKESHTYFNSAVDAVRGEGEAQRQESRKLMADMVSHLDRLVAEMARRLEEVTVLKAKDLASVNNAIAQDLKVRQDAWEGALKESLRGFGKTADDMVAGCNAILTSNGQTALQASERVAAAVSKEAQAALDTVREAVAESVKNQDRVTAGLDAMQQQTNQVIQALAGHGESLNHYIKELTDSARAWQHAPAHFQAAFNGLQAAAVEISSALRQVSHMPGQLNREMASLIDVMRPVAEKAQRKRALAGIDEQYKRLAGWLRDKFKPS